MCLHFPLFRSRFFSLATSLQELLAGVGVYKLPAMLLMFPEQEGMQAEMDPNRRKPRDGEKVRVRVGWQ